jgi:hypothetical protein
MAEPATAGKVEGHKAQSVSNAQRIRSTNCVAQQSVICYLQNVKYELIVQDYIPAQDIYCLLFTGITDDQ